MIFLEDIQGSVPTPPRGPAGETAHMYDDAIEGRTPPPRLARWLADHGDTVCRVFAFLAWTAMCAAIGYWLGM